MELAIQVASVLITSLVAYLIVRKCRGADAVSIARAFQTVVECIGAGVVFLGCNLLFGLIVIVLLRSFTSLFVSLYVLSDIAMICYSLIQGLVFQIWSRTIQRAT